MICAKLCKILLYHVLYSGYPTESYQGVVSKTLLIDALRDLPCIFIVADIVAGSNETYNDACVDHGTDLCALYVVVTTTHKV